MKMLKDKADPQFSKKYLINCEKYLKMDKFFKKHKETICGKFDDGKNFATKFFEQYSYSKPPKALRLRGHGDYYAAVGNKQKDPTDSIYRNRRLCQIMTWLAKYNIKLQEKSHI